MSVVVKEHNVGGIKIQVRTLASRSEWKNLPVIVLFLLHGRRNTYKEVLKLANAAFDQANDQLDKGVKPTKELVVVTFDHRNHGERTVDAVGYEGWTDDPTKVHNPNHATDMYSTLAGTAADVSFLIDFLPPYLYPNDERVIDTWAVAGISLGAHSTWLLLRNEPRLKIGLPIIGCPDYIALMGPRAEANGFKLAPPVFPESLRKYINKKGTSAANYTSSDPKLNPFIGRRIFVLSGGADTQVPWYASEKFVEGLNVGEDGVKQVFLQEGIGHKCTEEMSKKMAEFVWEQGVISNVKSDEE